MAYDVEFWSATDESNTAAPPNGWPEFMMPSGVNNCGRMMMGAIKRMYDRNISGEIVLPYLKLTGGSLSGGLGISGGLTASGTVQGSYLYSTGNAAIAGALGTNTTNANEYWIGGSVFADRPGGTTTNLHAPNGETGLALTSAGTNYYGADTHFFINRANTATFATINGTGISVNGGVGMSGPMTCGNANITGDAVLSQNLGVAGNSNLNTVIAIGWYYSGGLGGVRFGYSGVDFTIQSSLALSGNRFFLHNDPGFGMQVLANNNRLIGFIAGSYFEYDLDGPDELNYTTPEGIMFQWRPSDGFCFGARNALGGQGGYVNLSDRRFKSAETITPSTAGLPEILQLQPVEFQRLPVEGRPPPKREIGFIAQDVASVLPQAVTAVGVRLPGGSGGLDSGDPTLGVTSEAIVAALVNAVKTLESRLTAGGL